MSVAVISYRSMQDASAEAKAVSRKLSTYADNLNSAVYRKLNNYTGACTESISTAKTQTDEKIKELKNKSTEYSNYANNLNDLKDICISTDKAVRSMVSRLTADFKSNHGINNSKIQNTINYFLTSMKNSSNVGRWLENKEYEADSVKDYIGQTIEDWWDYKGGKELIKGGLVGLLEIAIGVCTVVGAIFSGGALMVIAGVIAGGIAAVNGVVNMINEGRAHNETYCNADPALGRRRSDEDTLQDWLRKETDSAFCHNVATVIDIVNFACTVITFAEGAGKLIKNGYKWATGCTKQLNDLKVKKILSSKNNWIQFGDKAKNGVKNLYITVKQELGAAIRTGNYGTIKMRFADWGSDFLDNLELGFEKRYMDFHDMKAGCNSVRLSCTLSKDIVLEKFDFGYALKTFVLPAIDIVSYRTEKAEGVYEEKSISAGEIYRLGDIAFQKILKNELFQSDDFKVDGNRAVLDSLNSRCNIDISVPPIHVPLVEMPVLRMS